VIQKGTYFLVLSLGGRCAGSSLCWKLLGGASGSPG